MDYALRRADEVQSFETDENPVPTKTSPLGVKGAGEAGNVGALAAITNAVVDALSPLGVAHIDMPATPEKSGPQSARRSEAETLGMPAGGRGSNNERMFRPAPLIPNCCGSVEESASRFKRLSASQLVQGYHLRYGG